MKMSEKLVLDFAKDTGIKIYRDNDEIINLSIAGDMVIFTERSSCGYYRDQHMIPLLDIVSWVYSKVTV